MLLCSYWRRHDKDEMITTFTTFNGHNFTALQINKMGHWEKEQSKNNWIKIRVLYIKIKGKTPHIEKNKLLFNEYLGNFRPCFYFFYGEWPTKVWKITYFFWRLSLFTKCDHSEFHKRIASVWSLDYVSYPVFYLTPKLYK